MRLFVAVDLPVEIKSSVATILPAVRERFPKARWVRSELLHLTVAFLGDVAEAEIPRLRNALIEGLEPLDSFEGALDGVGAFPASGKVRVLWCGLEPSASFERLAERTRAALAAARFPFDARPFRSHVTLARCDPPWPARIREEVVAASSPLAALVPRRRFGVDRVTLFSSAPSRSGPSYRSELEVVLGAAGRSAGTAGATV